MLKTVRTNTTKAPAAAPIKQAIVKPAMSASELRGQSAPALDAAYAAEFDKGNEYRFSDYFVSMREEIGNRIASPSGFLFGLLSGSKFPLYEARQTSGFKQGAAAKTAVTDSAVAVAKTAADTAKSAANGILDIAKYGAWIAAIAAAGFIYYKVKNK